MSKERTEIEGLILRKITINRTRRLWTSCELNRLGKQKHAKFVKCTKMIFFWNFLFIVRQIKSQHTRQLCPLFDQTITRHFRDTCNRIFVVIKYTFRNEKLIFVHHIREYVLCRNVILRFGLFSWIMLNMKTSTIIVFSLFSKRIAQVFFFFKERKVLLIFYKGEMKEETLWSTRLVIRTVITSACHSSYVA